MAQPEEDLVENRILCTKTFWASTRVSELSRSEPAAALEVNHKIRRRDSSPKVLENLAADPLEDLLVLHAPEIINQIGELAKNDPEFRDLLGAVWRNKINPRMQPTNVGDAGRRPCPTLRPGIRTIGL